MKLEIGKQNLLEVIKVSPAGASLASEAGEIHLPRKTLPVGTKPGDTINVFVYRDSHDRLAATTSKPRAQVGEFAVLEVKDTGPVGAFLDWGLEKDLLVPFSEQTTPMIKGERRLVRVYLDNSGRIAASTRVEKYLESDNIPFQPGEEVDLVIYALTGLGAKVIINGRFPGLLFRSEIYGNPAPGTRFKGYVGKIRADNKIDVTLRKPGHQALDGSKERILKTLAATGGFLPLGDKSPSELIGEVLKMSKKNFKKAVGSLYKEGFIDLTDQGIKLRNP